jgi:hypothetical protein
VRNGGKANALFQRPGKRGVGVPVKVEQTHQGVLARWLQARRRPRQHRRRAAHDQRRDRADRKRLAVAGIDPAARFQRRQRPVEPAGVGGPGGGEAAFEHVLAVEMGALPVRGRDRMHDACLAGCVQPVQVRHRRIEREKPVERQRRVRPVAPQDLVAAQRLVIGIADRSDRGKTVKGAAQHDHQQARVAAFRHCNPRHVSPGEQHAGGEQQVAARGGMQGSM